MNAKGNMTKDKAYWDGDVLVYEDNYENESLVHRLERVAIGSKDDTYWVSADGIDFAINGNCDCCIAAVEKALILAGSKIVYATFRRNMQTVDKWKKKWNKVTSGAVYSSSVRMAA